MAEAKSKANTVDGGGSRQPRNPRLKKSPQEKRVSDKRQEGNSGGQLATAEAASEVIGEGAAPPDAVETNPELSREEAERVRKKYLLRRFWISGRGYWGRHGDKLAWPFTVGLLVMIGVNVGFQYGINVWNRAIFDAIEKRDA